MSIIDVIRMKNPILVIYARKNFFSKVLYIYIYVLILMKDLFVVIYAGKTFLRKVF
ncbi:unnamed protein product [Larinioides sclopetarius]|uniref:Uncharacterized protein n=1 Tax=Larinioides sclopetarius TaxID=280406 RepID=A0AAV2BKD3_9ARAC